MKLAIFFLRLERKKKISRDNTYLLCLLNNHAYDYAKQSAKDTIKTSSKRVLQNPAKATGDLIGNKIANVVAKLYDCFKKFTI